MTIINGIIIFILGVVIGFIACAALWLKSLHDDLTKIDLELAKVRADVNCLELEKGE